jgi:hypothetical protein
MPIQLSGWLGASDYWQEVRRLADELLLEVPWLANWTVYLRPKTPADTACMDDGSTDVEVRWYTHFDFQRRQLTFGIPLCDESDDNEDPEYLASYLVLSLLDPVNKVCDDDDPSDAPDLPMTDRWN